VTNLTLDTNILFYALDPRDPRKHLIAKRVVEYHYQQQATIPLQCLTEFYNAATRKSLGAAGITDSFVTDLLDNLIVEPATAQDLSSAMKLHQQTGMQFFDCLLLSTVARLGIATLISEDMQHLQTVSGVMIVNPFLLSSNELAEVLS
jgi:predicted nucleic acid-binding protein